MSARLDWKTVDHLVYATPHLAESISALARRFGVRPAAGGRHPGRGTANALLRLGDRAYLEVIGPDAGHDNPAPAAGRPFGIDRLSEPRLVAWAIQVASMEEAVTGAKRRGYEPGPIIPLSRRRPDGRLLEWRVTRRADGKLDGDGLVPFLIDWGSSPHPSLTAPAGLELIDVRGEHPDCASVEGPLAALDVFLPISEGHEPRLVAVVQTPDGPVELR